VGRWPSLPTADHDDPPARRVGDDPGTTVGRADTETDAHPPALTIDPSADRAPQNRERVAASRSHGVNIGETISAHREAPPHLSCPHIARRSRSRCGLARGTRLTTALLDRPPAQDAPLAPPSMIPIAGLATFPPTVAPGFAWRAQPRCRTELVRRPCARRDLA